jgi:multiple sugar transport system permease protein
MKTRTNVVTINYRRASKGKRALALLLVGVYGLIAVYPIWAMILFASSPDDTDLSGVGLPNDALVDNSVKILGDAAFVRYIFNSFYVATAACFLDVLFSAAAGYSLARLKFPGRKAFLNVVLISLSLSPVVVAIPVYIAMAKLGLLNSYTALILPVAISALGVFLVRQYALAIPSQMLSAARVDGAGEFRIFFQIALPLLRPALLTLLLLQFLAHWDNLFWPLIAVSSQELWTIPLGLATFEGQYGYTYYLLMAAALISIIPPLILFVILQRYYASGLTAGGVKR